MGADLRDIVQQQRQHIAFMHQGPPGAHDAPAGSPPQDRGSVPSEEGSLAELKVRPLWRRPELPLPNMWSHGSSRAAPGASLQDTACQLSDGV